MRGIGKKASAGFVIVAMALALPLSLIGRAHDFSAGARVTVGYKAAAHDFVGKVFSGRYTCWVDRTVRVFKVRPGPDRLIGVDTTNLSGGWRIPRANPHGNFYARVQRRVRLGYAHSHTCLGDRSPTIFVQ